MDLNSSVEQQLMTVGHKAATKWRYKPRNHGVNYLRRLFGAQIPLKDSEDVSMITMKGAWLLTQDTALKSFKSFIWCWSHIEIKMSMIRLRLCNVLLQFKRSFLMTTDFFFMYPSESDSTRTRAK